MTRPARPTASPRAVTKAAAAEIQDGKVVVMSYPLTDGVPLFGTPLHQDHPDRDQPGPGAAFGENELTYMEDTLAQPEPRRDSPGRAGPHRAEGLLLNQIAMGKFINQNNMTKLGLEHLKSFATRGVVHRHGEGVPGGRQAQDQRGLQEALPRQGHR